MGKWGSIDFSGLKKLQKQLQGAIDKNVVDQFVRDFAVEMAFRALRKIKKRTPVDSGELRRNWRVGEVVKQGDGYVVEIINNTDYASFVEFGHRHGMDLTKWKEGVFMMTISMQEIERELPTYLERGQKKLLESLLKG